MAKKSETAQQPKPESFEQAMQELEEILRDVEGGDVTLEQSLQKYERGTFLLRHCQGLLDSAERKIEQLAAAEDGSLKSTPTND